MKLTSGGEHGPDQLRTTSRVPPEERSLGGSDPLGRQTHPELGNFPSRVQKEMGPRVSTFRLFEDIFLVRLETSWESAHS